MNFAERIVIGVLLAISVCLMFVAFAAHLKPNVALPTLGFAVLFALTVVGYMITVRRLSRKHYRS